MDCIRSKALETYLIQVCMVSVEKKCQIHTVSSETSAYACLQPLIGSRIIHV